MGRATDFDVDAYLAGKRAWNRCVVGSETVDGPSPVNEKEAAFFTLGLGGALPWVRLGNSDRYASKSSASDWRMVDSVRVSGPYHHIGTFLPADIRNLELGGMATRNAGTAEKYNHLTPGDSATLSINPDPARPDSEVIA